MPLVTILPNFGAVEDALSRHRQEVHDAVKARIMLVTEFPAHDVLVNIARCPWIMADPHSTDVTLTIATCPNDKLELRANQLCEEVAMVLAELGFSAAGSMGGGTEVWVQFLPGSWCMIKYGTILPGDTVPHPGAAPFTKTTTTDQT